MSVNLTLRCCYLWPLLYAAFLRRWIDFLNRKTVAGHCLARDNPKIQFGDPVSSIGVTYRSRNVPKTSLNPGWQSSQSWEPRRTNCTACRLGNRLEHVLSRCLSCSKPLPGSWAGIRVFVVEFDFAAQLPSVWGFSAFTVHSVREGPSKVGQLQGLPHVLFPA